MVDIRLVQNPSFPSLSVLLDWNLLSNGTLDTSADIETAILMMLGTDKLAQPDDQLPDPHSSDRRGWWGDYQADQIWGGWPVGWRGWEMARAKIQDSNALGGSTVSIIQDMLREGLTPFVQNKIISNFDLLVQRNSTDRQQIDAFITLFRGNNELKMKFAIFTNVSSITSTPNLSGEGPVYIVTL